MSAPAEKLSDARVGSAVVLLILARVGLAIDFAYLITLGVFVTRLQLWRLAAGLIVLVGTSLLAAALLR